MNWATRYQKFTDRLGQSVEDDDTVVVSCDVWCGVMWDVGGGGGSWRFVVREHSERNNQQCITSNKLHNTKHDRDEERR